MCDSLIVRIIFPGPAVGGRREFVACSRPSPSPSPPVIPPPSPPPIPHLGRSRCGSVRSVPHLALPRAGQGQGSLYPIYLSTPLLDCPHIPRRKWAEEHQMWGEREVEICDHLFVQPNPTIKNIKSDRINFGSGYWSWIKNRNKWNHNVYFQTEQRTKKKYICTTRRRGKRFLKICFVFMWLH